MKQESSRIILICPSWTIRLGLSHIIDGEQGFHIVESMTNLSETNCGRIHELNPDIIILDPSVASAQELYNLKEHYSILNEHILLGVFNKAYSQEIIAQFDAFFTTDDTPATIINTITNASSSSGDGQLSESIGDGCVLSSREKEVLAEVAKGLTNKEIADNLSISIFTVTTHRKNISQKLGIHSIAGLTVYAVMNHIVSKEQIM